MARLHIFHIDKEGFLPAFRDAFFKVFTYENYKKDFEATRIVPFNPQVVLNRLNVTSGNKDSLLNARGAVGDQPAQPSKGRMVGAVGVT